MNLFITIENVAPPADDCRRGGNFYRGQARHAFEATGSREVCGFYVSIPIEDMIGGLHNDK